ncbi:hypothetical protein N0V95_009349, partial [Ascochyta clinopodiicola]
MAITRQQSKRKAAAQEPAGSPPPKHLQHDNNKNNNNNNDNDSNNNNVNINVNNSSTRCGFLSLPRELRDEIYKHLLEFDTSTTMKQRNFITKSSLVATNRQICDEFLDAVLFYAPIINTTVRNHNFAHIVTFLNRLSSAQLSRFKGNERVSQQGRRKICITLTYSATKQSTRPQLNRWLDRFDDPNRRGAEIQFEYKLDSATWRN